jgi:hypothetical protein
MNFTSKLEETKVTRVAQHAKKSYRTVVAALAVAGAFALSVGTAQANDLHKPLFQISEVPAEGPSHESVGLHGPLGEGEGSMSIAAGHVWLAGRVEDQTQSEDYRLDEFDAATGAFVSQFAYSEPTLGSPAKVEYHGVAVGKLPGEAQARVYVNEGAVVERSPEYFVVLPSIGVYSESGAKLGKWTGAGTPEKEFSSVNAEPGGQVSAIAVDGSESVSDWAAGDVFVASDSGTNTDVVDVFRPEAGAGGEEKYVTQLTGRSATEPFSYVTGVTVNDVNGDLIVAEGGKLDLFEPTTFERYAFVRTLALPNSAVKFEATSLDANDGNGDIYAIGTVVEEGVNAGQQVFEFNAAGEFEGKVAVPGNQPTSIAGDPETHGVLVGVREAAAGVYAFGPNIVIPSIVTGSVTSPTPASATLNGTIDPDGAGAAECQFVWGTSTSYGQVASCPQVPQGNGPVAVQASLTGLLPDTTYHYRLQATNGNGTNAGEPWQDQMFTTPGPGIHSEAVANVSATSATFDATIDPNNAPTSYYVEYGTSTEYGQQTPAPPGEAIGAGASDVQVPNQAAQGLSPGTVYHYRFVAVSEIAPGDIETVEGEDHTFTTQAAHGSFALVDGRQWEMVSSPSKLGALIEGAGFFERLVQASAEGDAISYRASSPTESEPHGGFANAETVLSARGAGGWSSRDISPSHGRTVSVSEGRGDEFQIFSEDLSRAAVQPTDISLTLHSPEASEATSYLRSDFLGGNIEDICTSSCYRPLVTGKAGFANVPPGTVFGEEPHGHCEAPTCGPLFQGASPDLSHVVLSSPAQLTTTPAPTGEPGLYEWSEGSLQLLDVLPHGEEGPAVLAGTGEGSELGVRHSVSDNGDRVIMERVVHEAGNPHATGLYLRDVAAGETVRLDLPQGGSGPSGRVSYMDANSEGSRIFFLDSGQLTADSSPGGEDLYEYNISAPAGSRLTDLSVDPHAGQSADVQMMLGASEDGSYVYFAASGALAPGAAAGACCNLYVRHEGVTQLIAALPGSDQYDWGVTLHARRRGGEGLFARVAPNGRWLAFMSQAELTGYDTHDGVSGQPDIEVYLYHAPAAAGEAGSLACASCDPTGARPVGELGAKKIEDGQAFSSIWVASSVPPWTGSAEPPGAGSFAVHQPRYLSDSGRLFFDSTDALVPQDVDGVEDVYEYEPEGVSAGASACSSASTSGSVVFKAARSFDVEGRAGEEGAGCVGLISSGTSSERSWFLDASESGGDVFFITQAQLAPQDADTAFDVYDAHECTSASPCSPVVTPPPPCETEASCKAAPEPQPSIFGAPSSSTFSGVGNLAPAAASTLPPKTVTKKTVKCKRGFVKNKKGKCVRKPKKKAKRASNYRRASR